MDSRDDTEWTPCLTLHPQGRMRWWTWDAGGSSAGIGIGDAPSHLGPTLLHALVDESGSGVYETAQRWCDVSLSSSLFVPRGTWVQAGFDEHCCRAPRPKPLKWSWNRRDEAPGVSSGKGTRWMFHVERGGSDPI